MHFLDIHRTKTYRMSIMFRKFISTAALLLLLPFAANADLVTNMVGDARDGIPDNLEVAVTVVIVNGLATVTVDLAPMIGDHDDVKMHNFFFNMAGDADDYWISVVAPDGWVIGDGTNAQASGGADFAFEWIDAPGPPNNNVNIGQTLVFVIGMANESDITDGHFTGAGSAWSDVGSGQIGAHLQSLSDTGCSGFVWGDWTGASDTPVGDGTETTCTSSVPEPGTLGLLGLGILGLATRRRIEKIKA